MTNQEFANLTEQMILSGNGHHGGVEHMTQLSPDVIRTAVLNLKRSPGKDLLQDPPFDEIPSGSAERLVGEQMLWFDSLAKALRDRHCQKLNITCGSTLAFLWLFAIYAHAIHEPVILGVGCVFLAAAAFTVQFEGRKNHHAFLYARATAEVLRTYFFLLATGINIDLQSLVHRRYSLPLNSVLSSAQSAILNAQAQPERFRLDEEAVLREWFLGQQGYYMRRSKELAGRSRRWYLMSRISIAVGLCLIIASAFFVFYFKEEHPFAKATLTFGPMLLSAGAVAEFYREKLGFEYLAERYANSVMIYQSTPGGDRIEDLTDVGTQAIHEIIDWYASSVDREISVPLG